MANRNTEITIIKDSELAKIIAKRQRLKAKIKELESEISELDSTIISALNTAGTCRAIVGSRTVSFSQYERKTISVQTAKTILDCKTFESIVNVSTQTRLTVT